MSFRPSADVILRHELAYILVLGGMAVVVRGESGLSVPRRGTAVTNEWTLAENRTALCIRRRLC